MTDLTIGKVAKKAGVGVPTVRFYERRGLVEQPRKPENGFRTYSEDTIQRIKFIRQAQDIGFSLTEIEELLSLRADPDTDCGDIRDRALSKRDEVDRKIERLTRIRTALDDLITACPGRGALKACSILSALNAVESAQTPSLEAKPQTKKETCDECAK